MEEGLWWVLVCTIGFPAGYFLSQIVSALNRIADTLEEEDE